ncbi:hypothetical protein ACJMK2_009014 [Sinanodonta woodiana]|uniref:Galaxin-like repeats domain-containing protein n=1 Tax=Sinanodonta woodiana TaxID=1069815 RepID=A0ABD3VC60_SINWO
MYKFSLLVLCCLLSWITPIVCQSTYRTQYNPTFSMCCSGVVQPRSGLKPSCCGTKGYDATFSTCCLGNSQARSGIQPSCCGTLGYDAALSMCCSGTIQPRSGIQPSCCGRIGYDAAFRKCCNGQLCKLARPMQFLLYLFC